MGAWQRLSARLTSWLLQLSGAKVTLLFVALAVVFSMLIVLAIDLLWDQRISAELQFAGVLTPLLDGLVVVGLLAILLSALKEKAARLAATEQSLNNAQRIAHLGNWTLERNSGALTWSAEMFTIYELDRQIARPSYEIQLAFVHPEDRALVEQAYEESAGKLAPYEITHRLLLRDGRVKHVHQRGETSLDPATRSVRTIGTLQDITERVRLEQALEHLATHDALTGIFNRYRMNEYIRQEVEVSRRYGSALTLTMFDIDLFKQINDTLGHDTGDAVLRHVATLSQGVLRKSDLLARWGGDEFMILSHHTDMAAAEQLAERIRTTVAASPMGAVTVTLSFGVTQCHQGDTLESFLKRTDDALYAAKNDGRNRVVSRAVPPS